MGAACSTTSRSPIGWAAAPPGWRWRCSSPSIFGRVAIAQTMRDISPDLMDILGAASTLPYGTDGAADDGCAEYVYRFAPLVGIYGGTLEVFRNMIGQYVLGLGKPNYSPPVKKVS